LHVFNTAIAWLAILATTEASLFALPPYNFSTIAIGNLNIAPFIGFLFGSVFGGPINDWSIVRLARRNRGIYEPEMRLRLYIIPVLAMAAGLLMYGLTLAKVCQQSICEHFLGLTVSRECIGSCLPQAQG
jgi:MFS family permease